MSLRLVWISVLIVVGGVLVLSILNKRNPEIQQTNVQHPNTPSISFQDIRMTINSPSGQPQYKLSTPKYLLFSDEKRSEFDAPDIIIFRDNGKKIFATSNYGETYDNNNIITLIGDVKIKQPQSDDAEILNIFTEQLTFNQKEQLISTNLAVTAIQGSQKVDAHGMTFDVTKQVLYLHDNVNGRYEP